MAFSFIAPDHELTKEELAHMKAVNAKAEGLLDVLKSNRPDPRCMLEAIQKLEECVHWAHAGIRMHNK